MRMTIEQKKEKMVEDFKKNVDQYFEDFENLKGSGTMDINDIEQIWGQGLKRTNEIFAEATSDLSTEVLEDEERKKKLVQPVEEP